MALSFTQFCNFHMRTGYHMMSLYGAGSRFHHCSFKNLVAKSMQLLTKPSRSSAFHARQYSRQSWFCVERCQNWNHKCVTHSSQLSAGRAATRWWRRNQTSRKMSTESRHGSRYDLVVFGASGFTGQYVVEEVARVAEKEGMTWAVAGRSEEKLKQCLTVAAEQTGKEMNSVPMITADVSNDKSLLAMAKQAKVVLNLVGPYSLWGEPVVKACVEGGASHLDISAEPQYLEKVQLEYDEAAKQKKVYIIGACGFDSIPVDLGICTLADNFQGELNSVETYLKMKVTGKERGTTVNFGTYHSAICIRSEKQKIEEIRKKLFKESLPVFPKLEMRKPIHFSKLVNQWCIPFNSDRPQVMRSQRFFYKTYKQRPIQMLQYRQCQSFFQAFMLLLVGLFIDILTRFKFTTSLLLKYPERFTFGIVGKKGPTREVANNTLFTMTLVGRGWEEKLPEPTDKHVEPPNKEIIAKMSSRNPGYSFTATCIVQAALCVLQEASRIPEKGGVFTAAGAFSKTSLTERLKKEGISFEIETK